MATSNGAIRGLNSSCVVVLSVVESVIDHSISPVTALGYDQFSTSS